MRITRALAEVYDGHALKLLDPHQNPLPRGPLYRAVWLDRNPGQQALSAVKFLGGMFGVPFRRGAVKRLAKSFCIDRPKALAGLRGVGAEVMALRFEDVLADPEGTSGALAAFVGQDLDVVAMARAVLPRSPACQPDLFIEQALTALGPGVAGLAIARMQGGDGHG